MVVVISNFDVDFSRCECVGSGNHSSISSIVAEVVHKGPWDWIRCTHCGLEWHERAYSVPGLGAGARRILTDEQYVQCGYPEWPGNEVRRKPRKERLAKSRSKEKRVKITKKRVPKGE